MKILVDAQRPAAPTGPLNEHGYHANTPLQPSRAAQGLLHHRPRDSHRKRSPSMSARQGAIPTDPGVTGRGESSSFQRGGAAFSPSDPPEFVTATAALE